MKKIFCFLLITFFCLNNLIVFADNKIYDENNQLIYYSTEYYGSDRFTLPTITKSKALDIAISFIKNNAADVLKDIDTDNHSIVYNKSYPYGYIVTFPRIINNIEYNNDNISIFIDDKEGCVISFSKNFSKYLNIEGNSDIISLSDANNQYKAVNGIHLQYNKKISGKKIVTYLAYTADDILINAVTGNIIPTQIDIPTDGYFDVVNTAEKVSEYTDDPNIISVTEANDISRSISVLGISDKYLIKSVNYLKNYDNTYFISLLYQNGINTKNVTLNAKTGLLVEYFDNSTEISDNKISAEEFIKHYYKEFYNDLIKRKTATTGKHSVILYERAINDIPYKSNGIYACYENNKLKIMSFAWDNVEFSSIENIVPIDYAYEQFFKKNGLELTYHQRNNGLLTPVYKKSSTGTGIFDAESGRQLNYDGSYYYSTKTMNYLDIDNHYAAYAANTLSNCDIYVSSGNIFLEDYITQQEFLLLISEFINGTKPVLNTTGILTEDQREMLYAYMYENGIITRAETDYTGYVTRANAVKYFLRILGHGTIGEMSEIFVRHFTDAAEIPVDALGYVELSRSLGIIHGSLNNCFKPNDFMTNGDSLIMMYNYLKTQG